MARLGDFEITVSHCPACGGDGIDPMVKGEDGKLAKGEWYAVPCWTCDGTGHKIRIDLPIEDNDQL
jgi:formate dehydrogenase maturation protein FdhE